MYVYCMKYVYSEIQYSLPFGIQTVPKKAKLLKETSATRNFRGLIGEIRHKKGVRTASKSLGSPTSLSSSSMCTCDRG